MSPAMWVRVASSIIPLSSVSNSSMKRSSTTSASRATPKTAAVSFSSASRFSSCSPSRMPSNVSSSERISRVATRSWCTESNSSARTFGSHATISSRCARTAAITAAAGEPSSNSGSCKCGGRGAVRTDSPSAVASFDGDDDFLAPLLIRKDVAWRIIAWPSSVPAIDSASSSSHSRHDVRSPPGSSDQAVT